MLMIVMMMLMTMMTMVMTMVSFRPLPIGIPHTGRVRLQKRLPQSRPRHRAQAHDAHSAIPGEILEQDVRQRAGSFGHHRLAVRRGEVVDGHRGGGSGAQVVPVSVHLLRFRGPMVGWVKGVGVWARERGGGLHALHTVLLVIYLKNEMKPRLYVCLNVSFCTWVETLVRTAATRRASQFKLWTNLGDREIVRFTSQVKEEFPPTDKACVCVTTYNMVRCLYGVTSSRWLTLVVPGSPLLILVDPG